MTDKDREHSDQSDESKQENADPTKTDPTVAGHLQDAADALEKARSAQTQDPDNGEDPDDAAVQAHLENATHAVDAASAAQEKDGSPDGVSADRSAKKRRHRAGLEVGREFRRFTVPELRATSENGGARIVLDGMPIAYDTAYRVADMLGEFSETMHQGVCSNILQGADVRFLVNHDGLPLARTLSGTLELEERTDGLHARVTMDGRQQLANDLAVAIERKDVNQMSCGFIVARDEWSSDWESRDIYELEELFDVSAVTYPASPTTSIEIAQRTLSAVPLESRARIRQLYKLAQDLRAGKVLSAQNAEHLQNALARLHDVDTHHQAGVADVQRSVAAVLDNASAGGNSLAGDDGTQGGNQGAPAPLGGSAGNDGTGSRAKQRRERLRMEMLHTRSH
jgi:hypothetical protein